MLRRRIFKIAIPAVAAVACVLVAASFVQPSVQRAKLRFGTVDRGDVESTVNGSGRVLPAFEQIVNSPVDSRILEIYCRVGDRVEEGTPLLRLDLRNVETELEQLADQRTSKLHEMEQTRLNNRTRLSDLEMQVKVKEMAVNRLAVEVANERRLDSIGSGTGDRVRQAELAYNTGRLELEQLRQQYANERKVTDAGLNVKNLDINIAGKNLGELRRTLDDARIRAPRKATLTYVNDQIGQKVSEGERIAIISDLSHFKVDGEIADAFGDKVRVGSKAVVKLGRERMPGMVSNVTPLSRNGVISFSVRLDDNANSRLRSGLKTDVYILCDVVEDAMRLKNGSYYTGPGAYELFVFDSDDELVKRNVRLGESNYEYVEVREGLKPGDKVVISDMKKFVNSSNLKVK